MRLPLVVALLLSCTTSAFAQLAAVGEAGIAMGHVHLNVRDVQVQKQLWIDHFGALPLRKDGVDGVKLPGMLILFDGKDSKGGSEGTVLDHIGFEVRDLQALCRKLEARGIKFDVPYRTLPGRGLAIAFLTDPYGVSIELTAGMATW